MIKIVKTVCLFAALTASTQAELIAMNCTAPSDLNIIYTKNNALFDIINNKELSNVKKLKTVYRLFARAKFARRPNPNARDIKGFTVLHKAIENGSARIVKLLILNGVNINERNRIDNGSTQIAYTPVQWAILKGKKDITEFLIDKGAKINLKASNGSPTLHITAATGYKEIIRILLDKKTPIDEIDKAGNTALHIAAFHANKSLLELLIKRGCDLTAKNKGGFTAKDIVAFGCKNPDLFKDLGASGEKLAICHTYLKLVTDFFTTLKTMQESNSMFSCFDEDHITETFNRFAKTHLTGTSTRHNIKAIKKILYLDKKEDFTKRFTDWCKKSEHF